MSLFVRAHRAAVLVVLAVMSASPAAAASGDPGPADVLSAEVASAIARWRASHPRVEPRVRQDVAAALGLSGSPKRAWWDDYYAQRGKHFSGEVAIDTSTGLITATIRTDITIYGADHKRLYFLTFLPVTSVKDPAGNEIPFDETTEQGIKLTRITYDEPLPDGQELSFVFTMSGTPQCDAGGAFSISICAFTEHVAFIAMMEFLPSSLAEDFATYDLMVTVPAGRLVASTGRTVAILPGPDPDHEVHHVVQDFPTDAHSLSIGEYVESMIPWNGKDIRLFSVPNGAAATMVPEVLVDMRDILEWYSLRYGAFLFPKMDACEITDDAGAAFGWPALLWIPDGMFFVGTGGGSWHERMRTALFAHELAHQWFPDMIKMQDPYAAWLSEGFAEYSSVAYMATVEGDDYARGVFDQYGLMYQYYIPENLDYGLTSKESQYVSDAWVYQIVTYYKGATVANTIANVVGVPKFLAAITKLYADIAGKDAYYDTKLLQEYLEAEHGESLAWLFDQWVYGTGYPIYTVDVVRAKGAEGQDQVKVRVRRASSVEGKTFSMPVTLEVVTAAGEEAHVEMVDKDDMTFTYDLSAPLAKVRFDPERTFIKRVLPGLPGDADLSGEVDGIDLLYAAWGRGGTMGESPNFVPWLDFDKDGVVDDGDVGQVLDNFGKNSDEVQP